MVGELEAAAEKIEFLLSVSSWMSESLLQIDPIWNKLISHPSFEKIKEKIE